jgi:hypothetical protein
LTDFEEGEFDKTGSEILRDEGSESLKERIKTLEWVLDHDNPDLTDTEEATTRARLEEFRAALEASGSGDQAD